jgi:phosphoribosyl 1,2-cyclic phosphodiesterase
MDPAPAPRETAGGLTVCVLGGGSRGNAVYLDDGATALLVDAGFSAREIERRMRARGLDPARLDALLVTHEHTDHVRGAERLARRHRLPVYLSPGTLAGAAALQDLAGLRPFVPGQAFRIGTLAVDSFGVAHDARDPSGFAIRAGGIRVGIATDLGHADARLTQRLSGCRLVILESNHDPQMLAEGPYPRLLKQRIGGRTGHLSNPEAAEVLAAIRHPGLEHVVLTHLSATNNTPEAALALAAAALTGSSARLSAARQDASLPIIRLA